jgi:PAS domain S-box-containing protein
MGRQQRRAPRPAAVDNPVSTDAAGNRAELLARALDQIAAAMIVVDTDGRLIEWTGGATRMLGWERDEVIGRTWQDISGTVAGDPDPRLVEMLARLAHGRRYHGELTIATGQGGRRSTLVDAGILRDDDGHVIGAAGVAIVDDRTAAAENRFQVAFHAAPIASVITTVPGRLILDVNPAFEGLTGYRRDETLGRSASELGIYDETAERLDRLEETARAGEAQAVYISLRTTAGDRRRVRITGRPIRLADGPAIFWMLVDETERERLEEQLRQAQKMESIGHLAGGIAHDFNNLMTTIGGYSTMVRDRLGPDHPAIDDLEEVIRAAQSATALTRQLLAFSRRQVMKPQILDLEQAIEDVEPVVRRVLGAGVDLTVSTDGSRPHVNADPDQVQQVLLNLAINARDAMPRGGTLRIATESIELDGGEAGRVREGLEAGPYVRLTVDDTGVGMDPAVISRIFEPFFTTKGAGRGTGLGLSVVYGIVDQFGGRVDVESEQGVGSTFSIVLPRVDAGEGPAPTNQDLDRRRPRSATILVVEDERPIRELARRILERRGYRVLDATDGVQALEVAAEAGRIDLLLTDLTMPRMGGADLAARLLEGRPDLPIVYMSGYGEDQLAEHGVIDSSVRLLSKPFAVNELVQMVEAAMEPAIP